MQKETRKKQLTDADVKRKAVKHVIIHLKKKVLDDFLGSEHIHDWITQMDELLSKEEFNLVEYIEMRKALNDIIESILDEDIRFRLRDSWYSMGRALDKKAKVQ